MCSLFGIVESHDSTSALTFGYYCKMLIFTLRFSLLGKRDRTDTKAEQCCLPLFCKVKLCLHNSSTVTMSGNVHLLGLHLLRASLQTGTAPT